MSTFQCHPKEVLNKLYVDKGLSQNKCITSRLLIRSSSKVLQDLRHKQRGTIGVSLEYRR